jgi:probable addiction module antidote protein
MRRNLSAQLVPFDASRYLGDEETVAEYLSAVMELDEPDLLLMALGDIARARGMSEVARASGLGRESLYKALAPGAKPRFDTIVRVARALGLKFSALPRVTEDLEGVEDPAVELPQPVPVIAPAA